MLPEPSPGVPPSPYAVTTVPLLPDAVAEWLLRLTPAGGFAVQQTSVEYPQVTAHYAPSTGYFPLPWWAGPALAGAYSAVVLRIAAGGRAVAGQPDDLHHVRGHTA